MSFKSIFESYVYGGVEDRKLEVNRQALRRKAAVVNLFTLVAIAFLIVYTYTTFIFTNEVWYGMILLAAFIVIISNVPIARITKNYTIASHILVFLGLPVLLPWLVTGGPLGVGFYWTLVYVPWAFLLVGRKAATIWLSVYMLLALGIEIGIETYGISAAYSLLELIQLIFMCVLCSVLLFIYKQQQEDFFEELAFRAVDKLVELQAKNKK